MKFDKQQMTSNKPYLVPALYHWIIDNDFTPYITIDADFPGVIVPQAYVRRHQVTLNIGPEAVGEFDMTEDMLTFKTSFQEEIFDIQVPMLAVLSVFAHENAQGMIFPKDKAPKRTGRGKRSKVSDSPGGGSDGSGTSGTTGSSASAAHLTFVE